MKIINDKYYTPAGIANNCWNKAYDVLGPDSITEVIEPSVGSGAFLCHPDHAPSMAYDIAPECESDVRTEVVKQDFLKLDLPYRPGRLFIGNPPFGERMNLARAFYKKCVAMGDFIAFILPISQLNNSSSLFEFDLVYSEDLGVQDYSGRMLHCCFNIYKRPESGQTNMRTSTKLKDISIFRHDTKGYAEKDCDLRMCYWGNATAGKILTGSESYSAEYKIQVNNPVLKDRVISVLSSFDWQGYLKGIAAKVIPQHQVYAVLAAAIPEIA